MAHAVTIEPQAFSAEAWSPFGWVPVPDTDERDAIHALAFAWDDAHLNFIHHGPDEVHRSSQGMVIDKLYRHDTHTQALMPLNGTSVVAVAPALVDFSNVGQLDTLRAFTLRPGNVFVLHRGTWHWGPFPLGDSPVRLLNLQGKRYRDDNASIDLMERLGTRVTVRVPLD